MEFYRIALRPVDVEHLSCSFDRALAYVAGETDVYSGLHNGCCRRRDRP